MAANMIPENTFAYATSLSFRHWPILQISKEHGFGGINASDKEDWLIESVLQIFADNEVVHADELEDFVSEAVFNEFDTIVEDGSLHKLCQQLCRFHTLWRENQCNKILEELSAVAALSETPVQGTLIKDGDADDSSDDDDDLEKSQINAARNNVNYDIQQDIDSSNCEMDVGESEGWEVVRRSKKR